MNKLSILVGCFFIVIMLTVFHSSALHGNNDNPDRGPKMEGLTALTPKEFASVLVHISQNKASENAFEDILKEIGKKEKQKIFTELYYLKIFSIDFGTYIAIGNTSDKKQIMNIYYNTFQAVPNVYKNLKYRLSKYTIAVRSEHENGPSFMVGKVFSELCGYESSAVIIYLVSERKPLFRLFRTVSDLLVTKNCRPHLVWVIFLLAKAK